MIDENDKKTIQGMIDKAVGRAVDYSVRKRGDTPNDALQLTPLKFVTMNGSVAGRPVGSIATTGQFYLATDIPTPMWRMKTNWVNGVGSVVVGS